MGVTLESATVDDGCEKEELLSQVQPCCVALRQKGRDPVPWLHLLEKTLGNRPNAEKRLPLDLSFYIFCALAPHRKRQEAIRLLACHLQPLQLAIPLLLDIDAADDSAAEPITLYLSLFQPWPLDRELHRNLCSGVICRMFKYLQSPVNSVAVRTRSTRILHAIFAVAIQQAWFPRVAPGAISRLVRIMSKGMDKLHHAVFGSILELLAFMITGLDESFSTVLVNIVEPIIRTRHPNPTAEASRAAFAYRLLRNPILRDLRPALLSVSMLGGEICLAFSRDELDIVKDVFHRLVMKMAKGCDGLLEHTIVDRLKLFKACIRHMGPDALSSIASLDSRPRSPLKRALCAVVEPASDMLDCVFDIGDPGVQVVDDRSLFRRFIPRHGYRHFRDPDVLLLLLDCTSELGRVGGESLASDWVDEALLNYDDIQNDCLPRIWTNFTMLLSQVVVGSGSRASAAELVDCCTSHLWRVGIEGVDRKTFRCHRGRIFVIQMLAVGVSVLGKRELQVRLPDVLYILIWAGGMKVIEALELRESLFVNCDYAIDRCCRAFRMNDYRVACRVAGNIAQVLSGDFGDLKDNAGIRDVISESVSFLHRSTCLEEKLVTLRALEAIAVSLSRSANVHQRVGLIQAPRDSGASPELVAFEQKYKRFYATFLTFPDDIADKGDEDIGHVTTAEEYFKTLVQGKDAEDAFPADDDEREEDRRNERTTEPDEARRLLPHQALIDVVDTSIPYLGNDYPSLRRQVLATLGATFRVISLVVGSQYSVSVIGLCDRVWPEVMPVLRDPVPSNQTLALNLISHMATACCRFNEQGHNCLSNRIGNEAIPAVLGHRSCAPCPLALSREEVASQQSWLVREQGLIPKPQIIRTNQQRAALDKALAQCARQLRSIRSELVCEYAELALQEGFTATLQTFEGLSADAVWLAQYNRSGTPTL